MSKDSVVTNDRHRSIRDYIATRKEESVEYQQEADKLLPRDLPLLKMSPPTCSNESLLMYPFVVWIIIAFAVAVGNYSKFL